MCLFIVSLWLRCENGGSQTRLPGRTTWKPLKKCCCQSHTPSDPGIAGLGWSPAIVVFSRGFSREVENYSRPSGLPPAPGLSHTLPRSQYCAFFHHFPICCFLYLLCTSLIPDRWDSQTAWPMKKNTVKHGQQEVTPYLTSVLLTCNLQEGCVLRTIL